ncbi:hypothetical protein NC653_026828 [Populus alba x Populus x berolinensis]|uniref:Uncharacterized protein n=1 Tax=Populus alba x Populus x berolinensis TaxID=444605 RepID=A0AAD6M494_9ROSI|nr:hypothetical protein NC653_026780 [Populus alba x Populus x berolinensis]KAJ6978526.1 hypothetical protein NC653_026828 [Populus alba x Populus x berolinensis]
MQITSRPLPAQGCFWPIKAGEEDRKKGRRRQRESIVKRGEKTERGKGREERLKKKQKNQGIQLLENGRKEESLKIPERAIGREEEAN